MGVSRALSLHVRHIYQSTRMYKSDIRLLYGTVGFRNSSHHGREEIIRCSPRSYDRTIRWVFIWFYKHCRFRYNCFNFINFYSSLVHRKNKQFVVRHFFFPKKIFCIFFWKPKFFQVKKIIFLNFIVLVHNFLLLNHFNFILGSK